jgi:hypothetical protein
MAAGGLIRFTSGWLGSLIPFMSPVTFKVTMTATGMT